SPCLAPARSARGRETSRYARPQADRAPAVFFPSLDKEGWRAQRDGVVGHPSHGDTTPPPSAAPLLERGGENPGAALIARPSASGPRPGGLFPLLGQGGVARAARRGGRPSFSRRHHPAAFGGTTHPQRREHS